MVRMQGEQQAQFEALNVGYQLRQLLGHVTGERAD